jgi:hypothetical protein
MGKIYREARERKLLRQVLSTKTDQWFLDRISEWKRAPGNHPRWPIQQDHHAVTRRHK